MLNILVLGVGSNVSQGIVKALRNIDEIDIHIIGACISPSSTGLYLCDEAYLMPKACDEKFVSWYIETCNNKKVDMTFTGVEENIDALIENRETIEKACKAKFVYPPVDIWEIGRDKYKTCQWLEKNNLPYPNYVFATSEKEVEGLAKKVGFPLVAKPVKGKSSTGVVLAHTIRDLEGIIGKEDYVVEEYVGDSDAEYTVGCYFDKNGKLQSKIVMHRYLKNGSTSLAEIVQDEKIEKLIDEIAVKINMVGPLNIQIRKKKDGTPVCFEWNVRYSGTTAIRNHFGFGDVKAAIYEYVLNKDISDCFNAKSKAVAVRTEHEIYFEDEDFKALFGKVK